MAGFTVGADRVDCRCWINFDGTGTPSIRDDYNVSTISDNGTGDYTINFSTNMPNNTFAACSFNNAHSSTNYSSFNNDFGGGLGSFSTDSFRIMCYSSGVIDAALIYAVVFGA